MKPIKKTFYANCIIFLMPVKKICANEVTNTYKNECAPTKSIMGVCSATHKKTLKTSSTYYSKKNSRKKKIKKWFIQIKSIFIKLQKN